jgi:hypothetical protein
VQREELVQARSQKEAEQLLREARKQLAAGDLDDASITLKRIRAFRGGKFGLFEDSPDKLQADLIKARQKPRPGRGPPPV